MVVDVNLLKSEIVKQGLTQSKLCEKAEISKSTFSRRIRSGFFRTDEAGRIVKVLNLKNPEKIFFADKLT